MSELSGIAGTPTSLKCGYANPGNPTYQYLPAWRGGETTLLGSIIGFLVFNCQSFSKSDREVSR